MRVPLVRCWTRLLTLPGILWTFVSCCAEQVELQQKLEKKERECDVKAQEKEEMLQTLNKMKEKLEKESGENKLVKQQVAQLTTELHELRSVRFWLGEGLGTSHRELAGRLLGKNWEGSPSSYGDL